MDFVLFFLIGCNDNPSIIHFLLQSYERFRHGSTKRLPNYHPFIFLHQNHGSDKLIIISNIEHLLCAGSKKDAEWWK